MMDASNAPADDGNEPAGTWMVPVTLAQRWAKLALRIGLASAATACVFYLQFQNNAPQPPEPDHDVLLSDGHLVYLARLLETALWWAIDSDAEPDRLDRVHSAAKAMAKVDAGIREAAAHRREPALGFGQLLLCFVGTGDSCRP